MNSIRGIQIRAIRSCTAIGIVVLGLTASAMAQGRSSAPYSYALPIQGAGCGGFSVSNGSMYLFEYQGRQLYEVSRTGKLVPHEDAKGWYVADVAVIDGKPIYCSRDRIFRKTRGKIEVKPIKDSEKLISIAADDKEVFLLDAQPKSTIIVLNKRTGQELRRLKIAGRNPIDLVEGDGQLWVLDRGDRCIHRVDKRSGKTTLRFQAGPGIERSTHGLLFRDGHLYVHEGDYSRLRRVDYQENGPAVSSWSYDVRMTFVQESSNEHERDTTTVDFRVPVPPDNTSQTAGEVNWSQPPLKLAEDRYGQKIAVFDDIRIAPKTKHVLQYTVDVQLKAMHYDLPDIPLSALAKIDPRIRATYLASNQLYRMDNPQVQAAAVEARRSRDGKEPSDVRTLIENISAYVVERLSYELNDSWKDAATVLNGKMGSCSEYSFLFSALCRLNKIPTRLVGGVQIGDYAASHETKGFHRWTEVWFPELGWIPVDVTKIDGTGSSLDYEFLFGTPGYMLVLSQGDFDEQALGMTYAIWRSYRGGKRTRNNYVKIEPLVGPSEYAVVTLTK